MGPTDVGPQRHILTVRLEGEGHGQVIAPGMEIDCPGTCTVEVEPNTEISLLAREDSESSTFEGWGGACSGDGFCHVTVFGEVEVTANFALKGLSLVVLVSGDGEGSVTSAGAREIDCGQGRNNCAATYPAGTEVTLAATPVGQARFGGWSGACSGTVGSCTVRVDRSELVVGASFDLNNVSLNISMDGLGRVRAIDDSLDCPSRGCSQSYAIGTEVTVVAEAAESYRFVQWAGAGCAGIGPCTIEMDRSKTLLAVFERDIAVNVTLTGPSGRVISSPTGIDCPGTCSARFTDGAQVELIPMTTAPGARFVQWRGDCTGTEDCSFIFTQSQTVDAVFAPTIVTNGQAADLVLGQPDLISSTRNRDGESATSLSSPSSCTSDGSRLWVADLGNARILQWNALPTVNRAAANIVIGQGSFTSHTMGLSQSLLGNNVSKIERGSGVLFAADGSNNRLIGWGSTPTTNGASASHLLAQMSFTEGTMGSGQTRVSFPASVWVGDNHVVVADTLNSRVLIWSPIPQTPGLHPATMVLGQLNLQDINTTFQPRISLGTPIDVFYDEVSDRLFVADTAYNRILVWNGWPTVNGQSADFVLGQTSFTGVQPNAGMGQVNAVGFSPAAVYVAHGALFVADSGNQRVMVWSTVPSSNGTPADLVLGQSALDSDQAETAVATETNLRQPSDICHAGDALFVADRGWNRVVRYTMTLP